MSNFAKSQWIVRLQRVITLLLLSNILLLSSCSCNKSTKKLPQKAKNKSENVDKPTLNKEAKDKPENAEKPTPNEEEKDKPENPEKSTPNEEEKDKPENTEKPTPNEEEKDKPENAEKPTSNEEAKDKPENTEKPTPNEVIVFCGNPGVGKSALCNSIFGQAIFKSGARFGIGSRITTQKQEYIYENKLYIDTPGLVDVNIPMKRQAAKEIEKALKHNSNYKMIFVATLESGRIRPSDLVTVNKVCDAIDTHFNYGIIFNKLSKRVTDMVNKEGLDKYLTILKKKPSLMGILELQSEMEDEENVYFQANHENRQKLLNFISTLSANRILDNQINEIEVRDFQEEINKIDQLLKDLKSN